MEGINVMEKYINSGYDIHSMPFQKGNILGRLNKGRINSEETRKKLSIGVKKAYNEGKKFGFQQGHKSYEGIENTQFKKGQSPWNKELIGYMAGEKNGMWKGDNVGYWGLHDWVYKELGKPQRCIDCGKENKIEWANKSHEYKREINDWISLCHKCHKKYDKKRSDIKRIYGH